MSDIIDNGTPNVHCGDQSPHGKHAHLEKTYCDGVPRLGPFIELTIRVPLVKHLDMSDVSHVEALDDILDEGLGTFVWDEIDSPGTAVVMRLRQGGEDRVYRLERSDREGYHMQVKR